MNQSFNVSPMYYVTMFMIFAGLFLVKYLTQDKITPSVNQLAYRDELKKLAETEYNDVEYGALLQQVRDRFEIQDWKQLGFQRAESPITDFRSFGVLTLICLSRTNAHTIIKKFTKTNRDPDCLFFALTYINIGSQVLQQFLKDDLFLARQYLTFHDNLQDFVDFIDATFIDFEKFWLSKKPENIMAYNQIWQEYTKTALKWKQ